MVGKTVQPAGLWTTRPCYRVVSTAGSLGSLIRDSHLITAHPLSPPSPLSSNGL